MPSIYSDLNHFSDIRIFRVLRDNGSDHIECQLQDISLNKKSVSYTALSYVWGNESQRSWLCVNGSQVQVPTNLISFLEMLQNEGIAIDQLFWANAICINQTDHAEKSNQVRKMKTIFENADHVYAWLGNPTVDNLVALGWIDRILEHHRSRVEMLGSEVHVLMFIEPRSPGLLNIKPGDTLDVTGPDALYQFLAGDYWSRTWIRQESTTDVPTFFFCGSRSIRPREAFVTVSYAKEIFADINYHWNLGYGSERYDFFTMRRALTKIAVLWTFSRYRNRINQSQLPTSALLALDRCRNSDASDPRDKIYAPLGLIRAQQMSTFNIDYNVSTSQVYTELAIAMVMSTTPPNLDVLGCCFSSEKDSGDELLLPSWVPDWSCWSYETPFHKSLGSDLGRAYAADSCLSQLQCEDGYMNAHFDGAYLCTKGLFVDTISSISESQTLKHKFEMTYDWLPAGHQDMIYFTWENMAYVYKRTLLADLKCSGGVSSLLYERGAALDWEIVDEENMKEGYVEMTTRLSETTTDRRMILTRNRFFGIGPQAMQVGDSLFVLSGGQMLYVLRKDGSQFKLIGETYIHGLMDGQVVDIVQSNRVHVVLEHIVVK